MESSLCEKPERHAPRRLSDHLGLEGLKQKVHSLCAPPDRAVCSLGLALRTRPNNGSRMTREGHVRFREGPKVKLLRPTHPIVHGRSKEEARSVLEAIRGRFAECGLKLHSEKTRIVYCKEDGRPGKTNISSSTSSATPSNLDARRIAGGSTLSASCRRSATRPPR